MRHLSIRLRYKNSLSIQEKPEVVKEWLILARSGKRCIWGPLPVCTSFATFISRKVVNFPYIIDIISEQAAVRTSFEHTSSCAVV